MFSTTHHRRAPPRTGITHDPPYITFDRSLASVAHPTLRGRRGRRERIDHHHHHAPPSPSIHRPVCADDRPTTDDRRPTRDISIRDARAATLHDASRRTSHGVCARACVRPSVAFCRRHPTGAGRRRRQSVGVPHVPIVYTTNDPCVCACACVD